MHHLMRKQVAVYTEMLVARSTLVATARGRQPVPVLVGFGLFVFGWYIGEGLETCEALPAAPRVAPRDLDPVVEREEVVVGTREMGGEDEGEGADGALGGE